MPLRQSAQSMVRVFMLSSLPLFSQGVETLLCRHNGVQIVGRETDVERGIERIRQLEPDVVILDDALYSSGPTPLAIRILEEPINTQVIGLSLQSNILSIYRREHRTADCVEDLVEALRACAPLPHESALELNRVEPL